MNTKGLRRNYENLTLLQRLALADHALGRDDESEALAIKNASPQISYTQTDFCELLTEINQIRLCNIVIRLGYVMCFDIVLEQHLEKLIDKSDSKHESPTENQLKLWAYLYVRATDSWAVINSELGLRTNFVEQIGEYLLAVDLLEAKDAALRSIAFTEEEAKEYIRMRTGEDQLRTIENEAAEYRQYLKLDRT